jgi:hypothetical protein
MSEKTADLLDAAADILEKNGWTQYELVSDAGEHCLAGALLSAAGIEDDVMDGLGTSEWPLSVRMAIRALSETILGSHACEQLMLAFRHRASTVTSFNDSRELGNPQQVLDVLRKAAKRERM